MITWQLWRGLRFPPTAHPLFQRAVKTINQVSPPWYILFVFIITAPILVIPGLALAGTAYSLLWTTSIASNISREKDTRRYDQYALLPDGEFGANWILATACLHRNTAFIAVLSPGMWMIRAITLFMILSSGFTAYLDARTPNDLLRAGLTFCACMLVLLADNYQSIVSGTLIGMLVPSTLRDRFSAGALAFSGQAGLLMSLYLVLLGGVALLVPSPEQATKNPLTYAAILTSIVTLFILVREGVNYGLWRTVRYVFKTNLSNERLCWTGLPPP